MMYFDLMELPLKFKHIYEGILQKDNNYIMGGASVGDERYAQLVIYKRDEKNDICYPFQLGDDHIYVMRPYYSKFSFCPEYDDRVYKKFKLKDWEKAYNVMVDFEKGKIENDVYYNPDDDIDWEKEDKKTKRKIEKIRREIKKYLDENKISYEYEEREHEIGIDEFILNEDERISIIITIGGDFYIKKGSAKEWLDLNKLDIIGTVVNG